MYINYISPNHTGAKIVLVSLQDNTTTDYVTTHKNRSYVRLTFRCPLPGKIGQFIIVTVWFDIKQTGNSYKNYTFLIQCQFLCQMSSLTLTKHPNKKLSRPSTPHSHSVSFGAVAHLKWQVLFRRHSLRIAGAQTCPNKKITRFCL